MLNREVEEMMQSLKELKLELADVAAQRSDLVKSEQDARLEVVLIICNNIFASFKPVYWLKSIVAKSLNIKNCVT